MEKYAEDIIGDHQCGFRRIRSNTNSIFYIRQILAKEKEHSETVHRLLTGFRKVYGSVRREILYNILFEFGIPMKLVRLLKMCLSKTTSRVRVGKHLSDMLPITNGLKQEEALSPLTVNYALVCGIRRVQVINYSLQLNCTHQLLVYADDVHILG
jgi:hypothetical protein